MAKEDIQVWHSIALLFLSKFITSTTQTFAQEDLINSKNIGLGAKFATMLGSETEETEVKAYLKKAVKHLELQELLQRSPTGEMYLTPAGLAAMNAERARAMAKIAKNFPGAVPQEQNSVSGAKKSS
ncbi:MAG: hypothetical protein LC645_07960 [Geobacteraceae bacterium]|nr:hypothetical protein [Geobacteraceae bacterium]